MPQKPKKRRTLSTLFFMALWLLISSIFAGTIIMQAGSYNHYRRELNRTQADLELEKKIHDDLLAQIAYYESDVYIEKLAREQLGYVKPDEIVFKNIAD